MHRMVKGIIGKELGCGWSKFHWGLDGKILTDGFAVKESWKVYIQKALREGFEWDRDDLSM